MSWFEPFRKRTPRPKVPVTGPTTPQAMNNFTPRAQQVLALARKEADRFNHNFVGTEHMLLGLISLGQGVAVNVLQRAGVDLENLRSEIEKQVGTGPDQKMMGSIPYTPRVKKALELAQKEARALNHTYVGTEHLLLGLLHEGDGVAARVLNNLHVDIDQTRREILMELDPNFSPGKEISVSAESNEPEKIRVKPTVTSIDVSKRYDIYCAGMSQADTVIYRNALFKSRKGLLQKREHDTLADFLEIELEDGAVVFVAMRLIVKFCEHGGAMSGSEPNAPS